MHYVQGDLSPKVARNFELLYMQHNSGAADEARKRLLETLSTDPMHASRIAITLATSFRAAEKVDFVEFVRGMTASQRRVAIKALKGFDNSVVRDMAVKLYSAIPELPPSLLHMTPVQIIAQFKHHLFQSPPPQGLKWKRIIDAHSDLFTLEEAMNMDNSPNVKMRDYWVQARKKQVAEDLLSSQWFPVQEKKDLLLEYEHLIRMQ